MRDRESKGAIGDRPRICRQPPNRKGEAHEARSVISVRPEPVDAGVWRTGDELGEKVHAEGCPTSATECVLRLQMRYGNRFVQRVLDPAPKADGGEIASEIEESIEQARGGGRSLDTSVRVQMQQAFGTDFTGVRIHTDAGADRLNRALGSVAFTTGQDIFFRLGEFNPVTSSGMGLLAHELTHVVQQTRQVIGKLTLGRTGDPLEEEADRVAEQVVRTSGSLIQGWMRPEEEECRSTFIRQAPTCSSDHEIRSPIQTRIGPSTPPGSSAIVQRKIAAPATVDLGGYFSAMGVVGVSKSGNIYSHAGATFPTLTAQILVDMLRSGRTFEVDGTDEFSVLPNLDSHVNARAGVVDFASKKRYSFAAGSAMRMNPAYWEKVGNAWQPKPGVDKMTAMNDLNVSPQKYAIACRAATTITMVAGSGNSPLVTDAGASNDDWVPGDWGYIKNTAFTNLPQDVGLEGENIIYTGYQQFWGHFTGANTYRTLAEWYNEVQSWHGGASISADRTHPKRGLK